MSADRSRRRLLAGTATLLAAGVAGCLGDGDESGGEPLEPIDLTDGQACDACGMTIADHYGPAGQVFYADGRPEGRDGPARFDSVSELLAFREEREARGWEERAVFVTDYSSVDVDVGEEDGATYIATDASAAAFADATDLNYVVGSDALGAMGADPIPFSDRGDAETFADEHGGRVLEWGELSAGSAP